MSSSHEKVYVLPQNQKLSQIIAAGQDKKTDNADVEISEKIFIEETYDAEDIDFSLDDECGSIGTIDDILEEPANKRQKTEGEVEGQQASSDEPKNSVIITPEQRKRLKHLLEVPFLLAKFINSGDEEGLKTLIHDVCIENCRCKSPSLAMELIGRDYIIEHFAALTRSFPDYVMQFKPPTVRQRTISAALSSCGTRVLVDPKSYLFDHLKYGRAESVSFTRARKLVEAIESSGKRASFKAKSLLHLIVNKEMTHIERWVSLRKSMEISPAVEDPEL